MEWGEILEEGILKDGALHIEVTIQVKDHMGSTLYYI
jgi:hypothetical protein